jgi:hypothetical protein
MRGRRCSVVPGFAGVRSGNLAFNDRYPRWVWQWDDSAGTLSFGRVCG